MSAADRIAGLLGFLGMAALVSGCTSFKQDSPADAGAPENGGGGDGGPGSGSETGPASDAGGGDDGPAACDGSTCGIETVVTNFNQAGTLAVDDENIYVEDQGTATGIVYQCAKTGCSTPITLGPGYATGIASDAQNVYWNDFSAGTIVRCAIGGCANEPTVLAPDQPHAEGLSFDGVNLYWAATGNILTCTAPGCASQTILANDQSSQIVGTAAETAVVYWISSTSVLSCPAAGCDQKPTTITSSVANSYFGTSVIVVDGFAYYTSGNAIVSCPVTSPCPYPRTIGSSSSPFGLASDGANIYWLDEDIADVYRCPVYGCVGSAEVFADQTAFDPAGETGANVALDGEYVYWADPVSVYRKHK